MSDRVQDLYEDTDEFERLLSDAAANAANDWEQEFVDDMQERWTKYGKRMFLSEKQQEHLERIAEDD